jgi:hypothetical protein
LPNVPSAESALRWQPWLLEFPQAKRAQLDVAAQFGPAHQCSHAAQPGRNRLFVVPVCLEPACVRREVVWRDLAWIGQLLLVLGRRRRINAVGLDPGRCNGTRLQWMRQNNLTRMVFERVSK